MNHQLLLFNNNDNFEYLLETISKTHRLTKIQLFTILANYTYNNYHNELGDIIKIFPNPVSTIENWKNYVVKEESNNGKEIEQTLINFSKSKGIEALSIRGKGVDLNINGKELEVKSKKGNEINTMLQTSFYKNDPNKFYAFVSNTGESNITIRTVSSQLLFRLSLGENIISEINSNGKSYILSTQISSSLSEMNFNNSIETAILNGESLDDKKSFYIGNDVKVRFMVFIEPK